MLGLGTTELLIILVLVLVVFGAGRLPQVGSALGKGIRGFREGIKGEKPAVEAHLEGRVSRDAATPATKF
jgi:sec-independent protein translocase protein TatA